jgi:hypothetical protein
VLSQSLLIRSSTQREKDMDNNELLKIVEESQRYAKALEDIINRIELPKHTRILVDGLVKQAKERSKK